MDFPGFVWSAAEVVSSSASYTDKIRKYLDIIEEECHAEKCIVWFPDENNRLNAEISDVDNPDSFLKFAIGSYENDSASVARADGMSVMTLPVPEENSDYCICVQLLSSEQFTRDDLNFFIDTGDILSRLITEFRPKTVSENKDGAVVISAKDIRKSYTVNKQNREVLHGLSFDIYENEFIVVLGSSGTGKTSLMNILGGLDKADNGSIIIGRRDICKISTDSLRRFIQYNIGFVFENDNLMPNLTVTENIKYILELSSRKINPIKILEADNLTEIADKYPYQLSMGQQQKLSVVRALAKKSKIILADEPTGSLNLEEGREVLGEFEKITAENKATVILFTHNSEIAKIADRVIKLNQGSIYSIINNTYKMKAEELVW